MDLDPSEVAAILPPERRYERRARLWLDGPHEGWRVFDRVLGREVVLNLAYSRTEPTPLLRRARILATLRHPCIPPVYDLGLIDVGRPFYTTPLIEATPLDVLLDGRGRDDDRPSGSPAIRPLVRAMRDICRALEHAHRRGLLHLDLYPGNLRIGPESQEVLLDGGWEPMGPRDEGEAALGLIKGRPSYLSREQVVEGGAVVGPWTDVFGMGGLLHVLLYGVPPNHLPGRPGHVEVVRAIIACRFEPRRLGVMRPGFDLPRRAARALGRICLKALAAEPDERQPTAAALADELDDWLEGRSSSRWDGSRRR